MKGRAGAAPTPYIPNTDADRAAMLARVGLASTEELFKELPTDQRDPLIDLPPSLGELDLLEHLRTLARRNAAAQERPSFLGAGAYRRSVPAVTGSLAARSEFMTAYTPYQPEISQGTLQSAFEFQSVVCELAGLAVANTGLYDGASATAEACLLVARVTRRSAVALLEPIHPGTVDVVRTYAYGAGLRVDVIGSAAQLTGEAVDGGAKVGERGVATAVAQGDGIGRAGGEQLGNRRRRWHVSDPPSRGVARCRGMRGGRACTAGRWGCRPRRYRPHGGG